MNDEEKNFVKQHVILIGELFEEIKILEKENIQLKLELKEIKNGRL